MKIAILTLNTHNNYGNRLQNYALKEILLNYAEVVDTIWFERNNYIVDEQLGSKKNIIKYILNWKGFRTNTKKYYITTCIREYNIKSFSDRYIPIKYDFCIKPNLNDEYDYFIIGSDQVWNPNLWNGSNNNRDFFLNFAIKQKRIAYAASFGIDEIPEKEKSLFIEGLKDMNSISVREHAGAKIIKNLIGKEVPVVIDPTMLLSKEHWHSIAKKPNWYNGEKYIITYFLGQASKYKNLDNIIQRLSKEKGLKVYNLLDKNDFNLYTIKVEEFIYLIENAELVCADSFHATVFSILMNTPFLVVNCNNNKDNDMSSRLKTLLSLFDFDDRYLTGKRDETLSLNEIFDVDFSNVESILFEEKKRAIDYLEKALRK